MRVALAQLVAKPLDPAHNAAKSVAAVHEAADQGASLVILPELISSGYVIDADELGGVSEATAHPGICLRSWMRAARARAVAVVAGFCERGVDGLLYNSVAVIDSGGELAGVYRKLHLFGAESAVFAPGNKGLPVFAVDGIRLGVLVCYDLRFPECTRILAVRGAQVVALPAAWVSGFDTQTALVQGVPGQVVTARVLSNLNQVFIAAADRVGSDRGVEFLGNSVLCSPFGEDVLAPFDSNTAMVATANIDLDEVLRARSRGRLNPMADRRTDVYDALLGYDDTGPHGGARPYAPASALRPQPTWAEGRQNTTND